MNFIKNLKKKVDLSGFGNPEGETHFLVGQIDLTHSSTVNIPIPSQ